MIVGICTLTKSPANGKDAVLYSIVPSSSSVTYNVNTTVSTPSFVTVKLKKTVGDAVTYPSVLPDGVTMWYKLDTESGYGQVSNNGYVYFDGNGVGGYIEVYLTNNNSAPDSSKSNVISGITIPFINSGVNGISPVTYYIQPSVNVIQKDKDTLTPEAVTCDKYKQVGSQSPAITTDKILKYKQSSDASESIYSGEITISSDATYIDFILYDTNGTTILDKERVPILSNGLSVDTVNVEYASSTSNSVAPKAGWQTASPLWQNGFYIWARTVVKMSDGAESSTDPVCITGGKGISSITEYYYKSSSSSSLAGGSWKTVAPTWQSGYFIWTKSIIKYTDNTESETNPVNVTGGKGDSGVSAYLLDLTNENSSVTCDKSGAVIGTLQGTTAILYCGRTVVTGVTYSASFNGCSGSINATTGIVTITGLTSNTGTVTITATYQSQPFTAIYTITKVYAGGDGADGSNGWGLSLSPANIAIGDEEDGTLDLTTATSSVIATYGSGIATVEKNGDLQCVNCSAAYNATTKVLSITGVNVQDVTYTYNGQEYQTTAYCPNGYVLIPIKASYGTNNITLTLRLDFTVSGFRATQGNNFMVTKVVTDNNEIRVDISTIKQTAEEIKFGVSQCADETRNLVNDSYVKYVGTKTDASIVRKVKLASGGYMLSLSGYVNQTASSTGIHIEIRDINNNIKNSTLLKSTSEKVEYLQFSIISSGDYYLVIHASDMAVNGMFYVNWFQIEKGSVATPWTKNINDSTVNNSLLPLYLADMSHEGTISANSFPTESGDLLDVLYYNDIFTTIVIGYLPLTKTWSVSTDGGTFFRNTGIGTNESTTNKVRYYNGYYQYSTDGGVTYKNVLGRDYNNYLQISVDGGSTYSNIFTSSFIEMLRKDSCVMMESNTTYCLSFWAKGVGSLMAYNYGNNLTQGQIDNNGATSSLADGAQTFNLTSDWEKYFVVWTCGSNNSNLLTNVIVSRLFKGSSCYITGFKLEKNGRPTWRSNVSQQDLLETGIDIQHKNIIETGDHILIQDNQGRKNTMFETVNGIPMLKADYIQANKIVAPKVKTSETGTRTEIVNDMISQYNDLGELMVRIHGGTLNNSSGTINISAIGVGALNIIKSGSNGLIQEFDIPLSDTFAHSVLSLMNTIKVLDDSYANNVPIDCTITCNDVKSVGYELYVSDVMGKNMSGARIFTENPATGTLNLTKGMSGTAVLSSPVATSNCKIYAHFIVEFNNSLGSFYIKNESLLGVSITYGGNATEMAKDGLIVRFGPIGFKVTSSGLFKMTSSTNGQWVEI